MSKILSFPKLKLSCNGFFALLAFISLLMLLVILGSGCSKKKSNSNFGPRYNPVSQVPPQQQVNPNPSNDPFHNPEKPIRNETRSNRDGRAFWSFEYSFYDATQSCSTGRHVISGPSRVKVRQALCNELLNDEFNNHCGQQYRKHTYQMYCRCSYRYSYNRCYTRTYYQYGISHNGNIEQSYHSSDYQVPKDVTIQRDQVSSESSRSQGQQAEEHQNVTSETMDGNKGSSPNANKKNQANTNTTVAEAEAEAEAEEEIEEEVAEN